MLLIICPLLWAVLLSTLGSSSINAQARCQSTYFFVTTPKSWFTARSDCIQQNALLVSIESAEENQKIQDLIVNNFSTPQEFWTSGSFDPLQDTWRWFSTGAPFTYTNWETTPGKNPLYRVVFYSDTAFVSNWKLVYQDFYNRPFICEIQC